MIMNAKLLPVDEEAEHLLRILTDPRLYERRLKELCSKMLEIGVREAALLDGQKKLAREWTKLKAVLKDAA